MNNENHKSSSSPWPMFLSILALIFSLGAGYFAVNAAYLAANTGKTVASAAKQSQLELDRLINIENSRLNDKAAAYPDSDSLTNEEYQVMQEKDFNRLPGNDSTAGEKLPQEITVVPEAIYSQKADFNPVSLFANATSTILNDVAGGTALGKAWLAVYGTSTYLRVAAISLPVPAADEYFEAWLIKDASTGEYFSAGKMAYIASTSEAMLSVMISGDRSAYTEARITLEKNDDNLMPGIAILDGFFPAGTDFMITPGMLSAAASTSNPPTSPAGAGSLGSDSLMQALMQKGGLPGAGLNPNASLEELLKSLQK